MWALRKGFRVRRKVFILYSSYLMRFRWIMGLSHSDTPTDRNSIRDVERAKLGKSHIRIMLISGMSFFTDAYDLFVIGIVLIMIRGIFHLSAAQLGILASIALFGAAIGPMIFGYIGDRVGRRYTYWITILILIIGAIGSALSAGFFELLIWRFILGVGIGGDYPLSATIVAEYANKNDRGKLISSTFAMQGFGIVAGAILALGLIYLNVPIQIAWRLLLGFGAIPTMLILYARTKLNETPWYSLYNDKNSGGKRSGTKRDAKRYDIGLRELISNNWKYIVGTSAAWFLLDVSYYGTSIFTPYLTTLLGFSGILGPTLASVAILLVAAVPGYWVAVALIDKEGRKPIQAIGFLVMAVSFIVLAVFGARLLALIPLAFFVIYGLTFFFSNYGPNTTTYVYPVELYPTQYRARGHGTAATFGKLGAAISTLVFPIIILSLGKFALMGLLGGVALLGFIVTMVLLPETKRRSLIVTSGESEIMLITRDMDIEFSEMIREIESSMEIMMERLSGKMKNDEFFAAIKEREHSADLVVHGVLDHIADLDANSRSYTDVSHLIKRLDDIMDGIEAVASRFVIYDIKTVDNSMLELYDAISGSFGALKESMDVLSMVRKGSGTMFDLIKENSIRASEYENRADSILRSSIHALMSERDVKRIIKYKEIYEHMEMISDRCIDVIDIINDIVIKYKYTNRR